MPSTELHYTILAIDEGKQTMSLVDTATSQFHWTMALGDKFPLARDMQRLDEQRVLVGFDRGYFELDWQRGEVLAVVDRWHGVTAVTRRPDGTTVVAGLGLEGGDRVMVLTLDAAGTVVHQARSDGDYVRLMRITSDDTYLLCANDHILETTRTLEPIRQFAAPGFEHAWMAQRHADGSTWVSAGYGGFIAVFDRAGKLLRTFGGAGEVPAEVRPFFYAFFDFLPDGNLLVANWQGHGPGNGHLGRQLLQFDGHGQLRGAWSAADRISSLQGVLVLDSGAAR